MVLQDDRTQEQKATHNFLVVGTDTFLSGWGKANGGVSYAAWACQEGDLRKVENWVNNRSDMKRVRVVYGKWYPKGTGHAHIYVVDEGHNAIKQE